MHYDNYYSDGRVRARERAKSSPLQDINEKKMTGTLHLYEDGDEILVEVPVVMEVCDTCDGRGKHVNPSIDCNGLSAEDFAEDPDLAEMYMGGVYDVPCYGCGGKRVIPVIDRENVPADVLQKLDDQEEEARAYRREVEAERRFGC